MRALALSLLAATMASGCLATNRDAAIPMVKVHAMEDLACRKEIHVSSLGSGRYQAVGCNRTTIYQTVCDHLRCEVSEMGVDPPPTRGRPDPGDFGAGR